MAKIAFTKLGVSKNTEVKNIIYNEQTVEIKQYLPVEKKLDLVSEILNQSMDNYGYYNPARLHIYTLLNIVYEYTNISFSNSKKEDVYGLFDALKGSGLFDLIISAIPEEEIMFIQEATEETIKSVYAYKNSAVGIISAISEDYKNAEMDVEKLQADLVNNKSEIAFLKEVVTKLG